MKPMNFIRSMAVLIAAASLMWACDQMPEPVQGTAPEVTFNKDLTALTAAVNAPFSLSADATGAGRTTVRWYVDGVLESTSGVFNYVFTTPGDHSVKYVASNAAGEFTKEFNVAVDDILEVELSIGSVAQIERTQGEELEVSAIVISGQNVTHEWKIDGAVVSTDAYPRGSAVVLSGKSDGSNYVVDYKATNSAGTWTKSFEVKTIELPLNITFSPVSGSTLTNSINSTLSITATLVSGGTGLTHEWKVNGSVASGQTTNVLTYTCPATAGTLTVTYTGTNGKGETASGTWTVNVKNTVLATDFESLPLTPDATNNRTILGGLLVSSNDPGFVISNNPSKSGINTSEKVALVRVYGSSGTSGVFELFMNVAPLTQPSLYKGIRMKIYRPTGNDYYPYMNVNAGATKTICTPSTLPFNEWVTVEWTFPANAAYTKHQIRPLQTAAGVNITDDETKRRMYIDDIEMIL